MENQRTIEYCIKSEQEMLFYVANRARGGDVRAKYNGEVENGLKLSKSYCYSCKQVIILAWK
jgi:hypothetical protein